MHIAMQIGIYVKSTVYVTLTYMQSITTYMSCDTKTKKPYQNAYKPKLKQNKQNDFILN